MYYLKSKWNISHRLTLCHQIFYALIFLCAQNRLPEPHAFWPSWDLAWAGRGDNRLKFLLNITSFRRQLVKICWPIIFTFYRPFWRFIDCVEDLSTRLGTCQPCWRLAVVATKVIYSRSGRDLRFCGMNASNFSSTKSVCCRTTYDLRLRKTCLFYSVIIYCSSNNYFRCFEILAVQYKIDMGVIRLNKFTWTIQRTCVRERVKDPSKLDQSYGRLRARLPIGVNQCVEFGSTKARIQRQARPNHCQGSHRPPPRAQSS